MGTIVIDAAPTGYVQVTSTGAYTGMPLGYSSVPWGNGSIPLPEDTWLGYLPGSIFTLGGSTGTQIGPVAEDQTFTYSMSVDTMTIYETVYDPELGIIRMGAVIGTATLPTFSYSGQGVTNVDGDFTLSIATLTNGLYEFGAHLFAQDVVFNGSAEDDVFYAYYFFGGPGHIATITAGAGDDQIWGSGLADNEIYGGSGEDDIRIYTYDYNPYGEAIHSDTANFIDAGDDNDDIYFYGAIGDRATIHGGSGDDFVLSADGVLTVWGDAGDDLLQGHSGSDVAAYSGARAEYAITGTEGSLFAVVSDLRAGSPDGTDSVALIQWFQFSDGLYNISQLLGANDGPVAGSAPNLGSSAEDTSRVITAAELLAGSSDPDGDPLSVTGLTASSGVLVDNGDGTWTFTPDADDDTDVTFSYQVSDGQVSVAQTATLDLTPVNDAPAFVTRDDPFVTSVLSASGGPQWVTTGDVDGDGRADFVTANVYGGSISVFRNLGDGTFATPVAYSLDGGGPHTVQLADLDGDGNLDAISGSDWGYAVVLMGNGDGTFQPASRYQIASDPQSLAVGDFDNDNRQDIVAVNSHSGTVSVLLGNGDGTFQPHTTFATGAIPHDVVTADFNGDDRLDLAVANNGSGTVSVLLGNGDGTFQAQTQYTIGSGAPWIVGDDLDGDDIFDLAVTDGSGQISLMFGNGDGTFQTPVSLPIPANVQTIGDFDGDGHLDIVNFGAEVVIYYGNGAGEFVAGGTISIPGQINSLSIADLDGDGSVDVVTSDLEGNTVSVLLRQTEDFATLGEIADGAPEENVAMHVASGTQAFVDVDLSDTHTVSVTAVSGGHRGELTAIVSDTATGDGHGAVDWTFSVADADLDNLAAGETLEQVYAITIDDGHGGLATRNVTVTLEGVNDAPVFGTRDDPFQISVEQVLGGPQEVAAGDVDGDGLADLVTANNYGGSISVLINQGDGTFASPVSYSLGGGGPHTVSLVDLDGDNVLDAISGSDWGYAVVLMGNGDGTFAPAARYQIGSDPHEFAVGDFNGDGRKDIAATNYHTNTVSVLIGNGDGTFQPHTTFAAGVSPHNIVAGDFNGDDRLDLAVANIGDGTLSVLIGNGDGSFQPQTQYAVGNGALLSGADLNGDDSVDLAMSIGGQVALMFGNGDGTFQAPALLPISAHPRAFADLDGDGHPDIVAATGVGSREVVILYGDGAGGFSEGETIPISAQVDGFSIADLDGDGSADLVTTYLEGNAVSVILRQPGTVVTFGETTDGAPEENVAMHVASGTQAFVDVDLSDTHTVSVTAVSGGTRGELTASISDPATGDGHGAVDWTFSVADADLDDLAAGETVVQTYTITVDDGQGGIATRDVSITLTGTNDAPVAQDMALDSIEDGGLVIASFIADDTDSDDDGSSLTYTITSSPSEGTIVNNDDGTFSFDPGTDFQDLAEGETRQVSFGYTATDRHGAVSNAATVTVTVTGVNDAPNEPMFSAGTISEAATPGTVAAIVDVSDPEGDALDVQLLDDAGGLFVLVGNEVRLAPEAQLDFETATSHTILVSATDTAGQTTEAFFDITVVDANEGPDALTVDGGVVDENSAPGTVVATLTASDPDAGDILTYSLADDGGGRFVIVGNEIRVADGASLDFENESFVDVAVQVTDSGGLVFLQPLQIEVANVDETPTGIEFEGGFVAENSPAGTWVASLSATDPDGADGLTFSLIDDADGRFVIDGTEIFVADGAILDFEEQTYFTISVEVIDPSGLSFVRDIDITLTDEDDFPTDILVAGGEVAENSAAGTVVATLDVAGANLADVTFAIDDPSGLFDVIDNQVVVATGAAIDFESAQSYTVGLSVTDSFGNTYVEDLDIGILNVSGYVPGDNLANSLTGTAEEDLILGNGGNDTLTGLLGRDSLVGGLGNDTYVLTASDVVEDSVTELAGGGIDTVRSDGSYVLADEVENLVLTGADTINGTGNNLANSLTGNASHNALFGGIGNDSIFGGDGNDTLDGGEGNDSLVGGIGDDTYVIDATADRVTELSGNGTDRILTNLTALNLSQNGMGNVENLVFIGAGNFAGTGNTLANTITGGAGNDTIDGAGGADTMVGGGGDDTYLVNSVGDVVSELAGAGTDTVRSTVAITLSANVENLVLLGTSGLAGTGNNLDNILTGNAGANTLDGSAGADTMEGLAGSDSYSVDNLLDVVIEAAGAGTDTILTSLANYGLDTPRAANVENLSFTGIGSFEGTGNALINTITGGSVNDSLYGLGGDDILNGNGGADLLDGGAGGDQLRGGDGDDTYIVDSTADRVTESTGQGTDTIVASVTLTLGANVENLTLLGSASGTGNGLANLIVGSAQANTVSASGGNDTLVGGGGTDTLTGGSGQDFFVFAAGFGNDTVTDFDFNPTGGQDLIDLTAFGVTAATFGTRVTITDVGADLLVTIDGDGSSTILLSKIASASSVTVQDFLL
jgi:VCBS repeat-containing protein